MVTASYVEAYVARLQSMALLQHQHLLRLDDQAYPINTELLYITRIGMVWLMQAAMLLFHSTAIWVLRVITIASFILLAGSSIWFARTWSRVSYAACAAAFVLTPGLVEPSFFIADNLISASLASFAFALVGRSLTLPRWLAIGMLLALAMLIRLDAVLVVPAFVGLLWLSSRNFKRVSEAVLLAALGAGLIFLLSYLLTGVSLPLQFKVGRLFSHINNNPAIYQTGLLKTRLLIFFGFFGLVTLPLLCVGAWQNWVRKGHQWSYILTLLPLAFYLLVIPHANEIRDFCILGAPFVVHQTAGGWEWLFNQASSPVLRQRLIAGAMTLLFTVVLFGPPYISMRDGPRTLFGRAYSPIFWKQWQGRTLSMIDSLQMLVNAIQRGQDVLVISSQFEPDRYLHLRLLQEGFFLDKVSQEDGCRSIETFHKMDRRISIVRTENPYGVVLGKQAGTLIGALQLDTSLQCLAPVHFDRAYFFSIGDSGTPYGAGLNGEERHIPNHFVLPILHTATYGFFRETRLSPADVTLLYAAAQHTLNTSPGYVNEAMFQQRIQSQLWSPEAADTR